MVEPASHSPTDLERLDLDIAASWFSQTGGTVIGHAAPLSGKKGLLDDPEAYLDRLRKGAE